MGANEWEERGLKQYQYIILCRAILYASRYSGECNKYIWEKKFNGCQVLPSVTIIIYTCSVYVLRSCVEYISDIIIYYTTEGYSCYIIIYYTTRISYRHRYTMTLRIIIISVVVFHANQYQLKRYPPPALFRWKYIITTRGAYYFNENMMYYL